MGIFGSNGGGAPSADNFGSKAPKNLTRDLASIGKSQGYQSKFGDQDVAKQGLQSIYRQAARPKSTEQLKKVESILKNQSSAMVKGEKGVGKALFGDEKSRGLWHIESSTKAREASGAMLGTGFFNKKTAITYGEAVHNRQWDKIKGVPPAMLKALKENPEARHHFTEKMADMLGNPDLNKRWNPDRKK